ncbi:hypothetical protein FCV25MIE_32710, partial [Fagus crenata]
MKADSARPNRKVEIHVEGRASHSGREQKTPPAERQQKPFSPVVQSVRSTGANKASSAPNPGSDTHLAGPTDFEGQLREIDQELGIFNEKSGKAESTMSIPTSRATYVSPGTPHDPKIQQSPNNKGPLSDVTNITKLDRGVATVDWINKFGGARLEHLYVTNSDHKCLHLELEPCNQPHKVRKPFRFEEIWTSDSGCESIIQTEWDKRCDGMAMFQVWNKLKNCKKGLGNWSRQSFGNVTRQLAQKRQQLKEAKAEAIQGEGLGRMKSL